MPKRARVIKADELPKDVTYEPPLTIEFGVNEQQEHQRLVPAGEHQP